jgi:hypothetical protein
LLTAAQHSGSVRAADQPVPGATVTAVSGDKKLTTSTGDDGSYLFRDLPAGVWLVEIEMFGFVKQGQPLLVAVESTSFDWTLQLKSRAPASPSNVSHAVPAPAPARAAP